MSKPPGTVQPLGMALVLAIGFGGVFAIAALWGISIWEGPSASVNAYENLVVRADGTPLIQHNAFNGFEFVVTYTALDGKEVSVPKKITDENYWIQGSSLVVGGNIRLPWKGSRNFGGMFQDKQTPPRFWYLLFGGVRDGRGYFVGYDSQSKLCVGFIGRDGFRPDQPPADQWFPVDDIRRASGAEWVQYTGNDFWNADYHGDPSEPVNVAMISGAQLLGIDLRKGTVTTFMESADLVDMIDIKPLVTVSTSKAAGESEPSFHSQTRLVGRTTDRVIVLGARGKQRSTYLLLEELRNRSFTFYVVDAGTALIVSNPVLSDRRRREELTWIDASGKVLRRAEASLINVNGLSDEHAAWMSAVAAPSPLTLAVIATVAMPLAHLGDELAPNYSTALAHSLTVSWPALLVVTLLAAVLALFCCRRQRRYYQSASIVWFVFVLLLGLPGLVGYLFHRRWPVLEKCPACGHDVPRDREDCANCRAAFPPPPPKGCEVFA